MFGRLRHQRWWWNLDYFELPLGPLFLVLQWQSSWLEIKRPRVQFLEGSWFFHYLNSMCVFQPVLCHKIRFNWEYWLNFQHKMQKTWKINHQKFQKLLWREGKSSLIFSNFTVGQGRATQLFFRHNINFLINNKNRKMTFRDKEITQISKTNIMQWSASN